MTKNKSLQDNITLCDWCNSIILNLKSPHHSTKPVLILEGSSDVSFFSRFFGSDFFCDSPACGKSEVIKAVTILKKNLNRIVVGICDADFDYLENIYYDDIFLTDYHDIETILIEGNALEDALHECLDHSLINSSRNSYNDLINQFKTNILDVTYYIGLIKWLNVKDKLNLNFSGMAYDNFIHINENSKAEFILDDFINHILSRTTNIDEKCNTNYLIAGMNKLKTLGADYKHICNGHDFTYILSMVIKKKYCSSKNINQNKIESLMRAAYKEDNFKKTKLYELIKKLV